VELIRRVAASGLLRSPHHQYLTILVHPLPDEADALVELERRGVVRQDLHLEAIEALAIGQLEESLQEGPLDPAVEGRRARIA